MSPWRFFQKFTFRQGGPLKYQTGAEVGETLVLDHSAVPMDAYGRRLLREGTLLCKITASGKYGPYDPDASDGRETVARGSAYVLWGSHDVVLGDVAVGGLFQNCVFDTSELSIGVDRHGLYTKDTLSGTIIAAFPTCTFDD